MAANREYTRKQDAVRAAKKEFGENWNDSVEIMTRHTPNGDRFIYDFPLRNGEATAAMVQTVAEAAHKAIDSMLSKPVQEFLKETAAAEKARKSKKAELMANKPVHIPATPESTPAEGSDQPQAPESGDDGHIEEAFRAAVRSTADACEHISEDELEAWANSAEGGEVSEGGVPDGQAEDPQAWLKNAQKAADAQANASTANVDPLKPRISTAEKPTKLVWTIADELTAKNPSIKRSEVITECVNRGIAYGTARTQYQHWFKQKNDSANEPRAQVQNGKVIPPANTAKH